MTKLDSLLSICNDNVNDEMSYINDLYIKRENVLEFIKDEKFTNKELIRVNSYSKKLGLEPFLNVEVMINHLINKIDSAIKFYEDMRELNNDYNKSCFRNNFIINNNYYNVLFDIKD